MLSAQELIEPKSASTSQTACGSAAMVRLRSMAATASRYAAEGPRQPTGRISSRNRGTRWPVALLFPWTLPTTPAECNDDV